MTIQGAGKPKILVTGARAPVALHLARLLHSSGCSVFMADHLSRPISSASMKHNGYYKLPAFSDDPDAAAEALSRLIYSKQIDLVIPTCEEIFYLALFREACEVPVPLFAPPMKLLEQVHNKYTFVKLCEKLDLPFPETHLVTSPAELEKFAPGSKDLVFKPVWSRFASHVLLRPTPATLTKIKPSQDHPWVAQQYLPGEEISAYAIAREGRLVALSAYRALARAGKGAAVCFEPVSSAQIRDFIEEFVHGTAWTGQISFDFILEKTGHLRPLECNPRATSGLHFFSQGSSFSNALLSGSPEAQPDITRPQGVRLALWTYGPAMLFQKDERKRFFRALRQVEDVINLPGDTVTTRSQLASVAEFAAIALKKRKSLQQASTYDIEWNGPAA